MSMSIDISKLRRITSTDPPRALIYGPPGMGKTTLASEWPSPIFLQVEDGAPAGLELLSFGRLESYDDVISAIGALYEHQHDGKTVVLDSLDRIEPLVWQKTCEARGWENIETPGYGKGYVEADTHWRELIGGMNALRYERGMNIVYVAHSTIATVDDPMTQSYSRFDIKLHRRATGLFQDEVDAILFLNQDVVIKTDNKARTARTRADGGGHRWIYSSPRPSFVAKNRYGIPDRIEFKKGAGYANLLAYFPGAKQNGKQNSNHKQSKAGA
jgi:hypothetical protein